MKYHCEVCGKGFNDIFVLLDHEAAHERQKRRLAEREEMLDELTSAARHASAWGGVYALLDGVMRSKQAKQRNRRRH